MTQFADEVSIRFTSQLILGISRVLHQVLKHFKGTAILTSFVLPAARVLPVILALNLNDSDSVMLSLALYLCYCHRTDFLMFSHNCCTIRLYTGITTSRSFALSTSVLLIWLIKSVNDAQFLNCYLLISFICIPCCSICSCPSNSYGSLGKYIRITIVTETRLQHRGLEFDLNICDVCSNRIIIHLNPIFCSGL